MRGVASQITLDNPFTSNYSNIKLTLFGSMHPRDAIINQDESFCALITMQPRLEWGINGDKSKINHSISSVNELTWGGNVRFSPNVSTMLEFTFYESLYDRVLDASETKIIETVLGGADDPVLDQIRTTAIIILETVIMECI